MPKKTQLDSSKKSTLVLSGGGAPAYAWQTGAIRRLREHSLLPGNVRNVIGTSAGALGAPLVALYYGTADEKYIEEQTRIAKNTVTDHVLSSPIPGPIWLKAATSLIQGRVSIYDIDPLRKLVEEFFPQEAWQRLQEPGMPACGVCVIDVTKREPHMVLLNTGDRGVRCHTDAVLAILASAVQPGFMPPVWVEAVGDFCYDGGLREASPVEVVMSSQGLLEDFDYLVALDVDQYAHKMHDSVTNMLQAAGWGVGTLIHNVYQNDVDRVAMLNGMAHCMDTAPTTWDALQRTQPRHIWDIVKKWRYKPIHRFRPRRDAGLDSLDFDKRKMAGLVKRGYGDLKALAE